MERMVMRRVPTRCARSTAAPGGRPRGRVPAESSSLLHVVVESLPNAVAVVDTEGRVFAMNRAFRARGSSAGTRCEDLSHLGGAFMAAVRAAAAGHSPAVAIQICDESGTRFECRCIDPDNPLVAVIADAEP